MSVSHPALLHQVGDHDDDPNVLLPHHPPEVLSAGLQRPLGCDIGPGLVKAMERRCREGQQQAMSYSKLVCFGIMFIPDANITYFLYTCTKDAPTISHLSSVVSKGSSESGIKISYIHIVGINLISSLPVFVSLG